MATYDELRAEVGREVNEVVELDLDFCTLTYGIAPCEAAIGVTGDVKCFNTRITCQDVNNYSPAAKTYRFSKNKGKILKPNANGTDTARPLLMSVKISPTENEPSEGLGVRASITAVFKDETSNDVGIDKYVDERTYDPNEQGSFWGKLLARNPFYNGRRMRYKVGYFDESTGQLVTQTREYFIDKITGPDAKGKVTVIGKDVLKLADDKRAQAPFINSGVLDADINDSVLSATLSPAGIGDQEYAASGTLRIDDETMTFTRVADALTFIARGTDGTTADAHTADASIQECLRFTAEPINDILFTLLNTYANIEAGFLDTVQWQAEVDLWLSANNYTALITEPNGVNELITELIQQGLFYIWWDEIEQKVQLKAIAPPRTAVKSVNDSDNVLRGTMKVEDDEEKRLTEVWVHFGIKDPTGEIDKISNYKKLEISLDPEKESTDQFGDVRVRNIFSRWMSESDKGLAVQLGGRLLARYAEMPKKIEFELDAQDSDLWTGGDFDLTTASIQDVEGAQPTLAAEVLSVLQKKPGSTYTYTAELTRFSGRYAFIAPDSINDNTPNYELETGGDYELETTGEYQLETNDYSVATDAQKDAFGFICYDTGFFLDGTPAYKIL